MPIGTPTLYAANARGGDSSAALTVTLPAALPSDALCFLAVFATRISAAPTAPTVSGGGVTWDTEVANVWKAAGTGQCGFWLYRAVASAPSGTTITVTPGSTYHTVNAAVVTVGSTVSTGNGAGAIVQSTGLANGSNSANTVIGRSVSTLADTTHNGFIAFAHVVGTGGPYSFLVDGSPAFTEILDDAQSGGTRNSGAHIQHCVGTSDSNPTINATINAGHDGSFMHVVEVAFNAGGGGGSNAARPLINGALRSPLIHGGLIR